MLINLNNIALYYEEYGEGSPIIFLHGNGESHHIFDGLISKLKSNYKIYLVDSRCHGKSTKNIPISYELMAADMEEFIAKLGINSPIIYGFSDGGIIALLMAIRGKALLKKIIISGANLTPGGLTNDTINEAKLAYRMNQDKLAYLMLSEPNINVEMLKKISIPTHILVGENDVVKMNETNIIHDSIVESTLEIIKNENHYSYVMDNDKLYNIIIKYF